MALSAMCDYTPKEIIAQVSVLISQDIFKEEYECNVKEIIKGYLEMFGKKDFDKETFFRSVSEKSIGYYVQGMKLTLFFLYFYDEIDESKCTKYREMINIICNCGGDTDTNAAIVGCVLGAIIGFDNFGNELKVMLDFAPKKRTCYFSGMIYFFVNYLQESQEEIEKGVINTEYRFNFYKAFMTLLNTEMK